MNGNNVFDAIDNIIEALYTSNNGNVNIAKVEDALAKQGFIVDQDIYRESFNALVVSKVQFLQSQ